MRTILGECSRFLLDAVLWLHAVVAFRSKHSTYRRKQWNHMQNIITTKNRSNVFGNNKFEIFTKNNSRRNITLY